MVNLSLATQVFLCLTPTDMRKSFDSLAALVRDQLQRDPLSGHLFVFRSKRQDRIKLLYWDQDGYALWYKRLEKGNYSFPIVSTDSDLTTMQITSTDLALILAGIDLQQTKRRPRYHRPNPQPK